MFKSGGICGSRSWNKKYGKKFRDISGDDEICFRSKNTAGTLGNEMNGMRYKFWLSRKKTFETCCIVLEAKRHLIYKNIEIMLNKFKKFRRENGKHSETLIPFLINTCVICLKILFELKNNVYKSITN